ncbi:hypothetical protein V6N11_048578 [Hibiscus sabdariffa]|uniref:Uncharacterized protein n=1 Tax=Hibiscus sabdariffa TaxID=183260 RepID=A0ABR2PVN5_9ROSI
MFEEKARSCSFPDELVGLNLALACFDAIIAILAFTQLARIHSRNTQLGWTRQKAKLGGLSEQRNAHDPSDTA